jgi:hypothetical protein
MREILFRGKRLGESQWIEGSLKQTGGICEIHTFDNEAYAKEAENGWDIFDYTNDVTVDPETVCQFTGLTDKNGVKIWENEWLYATVRSAVFHNYQGKVIFYNGSFLLHAIDPETGLFNNIDDAKPLSDYYELQVINNPELLNQ